METQPLLRKIVSLAALALVSPALHAENGLSGKIYGLAGSSDNAYKSPTTLLDERQDEYGLTLSGEYTNALIEFIADYNANERRFSEDSQINKSTLDGSSTLVIGKDHQPLDLHITHSRTTLLKAPDQINITNNQDSREIFTVAPNARFRISGADQVQLSVDSTQVKFLENVLLDSTRQGASLILLHGGSVTQNVQLMVQATEIDFDTLSEFNYTSRKAMLGYAVQLRKLGYRIELGYNQSDPEIGFTETSPAYSLDITYKTGQHDFELTSAETITDTSVGNGNQPSLTDLSTSDGSGGAFGLIKRQDNQARWNISALCAKCDLTATVFLQRDDYINDDKQQKSTGGSLTFNYSFTKASAINVRYTQSKFEFSGADLGRDYDSSIINAEYSYTFMGALALRLMIEDEDRSSENLDAEYSEKFVGIGLSYSF